LARPANSEDLKLVASPAVGAAYAAHWRERLAVSAPFTRREDWCRVVYRAAERNGDAAAAP
jgi:hypothetical protein